MFTHMRKKEKERGPLFSLSRKLAVYTSPTPPPLMRSPCVTSPWINRQLYYVRYVLTSIDHTRQHPRFPPLSRDRWRCVTTRGHDSDVPRCPFRPCELTTDFGVSRNNLAIEVAARRDSSAFPHSCPRQCARVLYMRACMRAYAN